MNSLYVHIPFCENKCPYCSFVVSVATHHVASYLHALKREMSFYAKQKVYSIYIGGGTPTILNSSQLRFLMESIRERFEFSSQTEVSIEANPEALSLSKMKLLKRLGVNRVSLGVQSFNKKYLKFLGRNHTSARALESFSLLRASGFKNINIDLMYGFSGQSVREVEEDILQMCALDCEHASFYSLSIEKGSLFFTKRIRLNEEKKQVAYFLSILKFLKRCQFQQYEISNFSKKGKESVHNIHYWTGGNYIGIGVGAHSHVEGNRYSNVLSVIQYIGAITRGKRAEAGREKLDLSDRFIESLLFGLRMNEGVDVLALEERYGFKMQEKNKKIIDSLLEEKFLEYNGSRLRVTDKGRIVLDEICARMI